MQEPPVNFKGREPNLGSWAERNGFADWALALLWIIVAFILFQITAGFIALVLILMTEQLPADPQEVMNLLTERLELVFIGNSFGQIVFLGLATWLVTRLHTKSGGEKKQFLRFRFHKDTAFLAGIGTVLIITVQPVIWFLGWINAQVPVPPFFENMQQSQMELIQGLLQGEYPLVLTLFNVGIVPAVCEEILYRGYVMRAFERSWGIWAAIIISGILFGLYHVQLTNLLPLAFIGIILAFITWISDSIYPAMIVHFVNNGGSVLVGTYYPDSVVAEITPESMPPVWVLAAALIISAYLVYFMYKHVKNVKRGVSDV